jgi:hypothetical protein
MIMIDCVKNLYTDDNFMTFSEISYAFQRMNGLGMMTWSLDDKFLQEHIQSESSV